MGPTDSPSTARLQRRQFITSCLLLASAIGGCSRPKKLNMSEASANSFLALGDSYTIGEGVKDPERWPVQFAGMVRAKGFSLDDPTIIARTGWTIDELQTAVDASGKRGPFGLVTLMVGVNDQFRGRSPDACRGAFQKLLTTAVNLAGNQPSRVIVISIPDWGVTPFAAGRDTDRIAAEIDQFNRMEKEYAAAAGVHYIGITPISREARNQPEFVASDGLHPSGIMHQRWAEAVLPVVVKILHPAGPTP
jgi:lysophospholipase L1-like esterase